MEAPKSEEEKKEAERLKGLKKKAEGKSDGKEEKKQADEKTEVKEEKKKKEGGKKHKE